MEKSLSDVAKRSRGIGSIPNFKFGDLLGLKLKSFGGEGYKTLTDILEKETKKDDTAPV